MTFCSSLETSIIFFMISPIINLILSLVLATSDILDRVRLNDLLLLGLALLDGALLTLVLKVELELTLFSSTQRLLLTCEGGASPAALVAIVVSLIW